MAQGLSKDLEVIVRDIKMAERVCGQRNCAWGQTQNEGRLGGGRCLDLAGPGGQWWAVVGRTLALAGRCKTFF